MVKVIGVAELQRRFRSVLDEVARGDVFYVLIRGSRPVAAIIPYDVFLRFMEREEKEVSARFDRLMARMAERNAGRSDEEIAADVEAALNKVRQR